jgi:E3 ubiquitin-protein ligase TRIP12
MNALLELCDVLAMATEDSMGGFKASEFVPVLVQLLHLEHNPDIMLLATRALAYMVEALPRSANLMVNSDAITVFCSRMLSIEYIDVAEQSLQVSSFPAMRHNRAGADQESRHSSGSLRSILLPF